MPFTLRSKISFAALFILTFLLPALSHAQVADSRLQMCIDEHMQDNGWATPTEIEFLDCSGRAIENLDGIELLPNLQSLDVSRNLLAQVYALTSFNMPALTSLDISHNSQLSLGDVTSVVDFQSSITSLGLRGIELIDLSIFSPSEAARFESLDVSDTGLSDLYGIEQFTNLKTLKAADNQLEHLQISSSNSGLESIDLKNNRIYSVSALMSLSNLIFLDVGYNPIQPVWDIEQIVSQNPNLQGLGIAGLAEMPNLEFAFQNPGLLTWLDISDQIIEDAYALYAFDNLQTLIANNIVGDTLGLVSSYSQLRTLEFSNSGFFDANDLNELMELTSINLLDTRVINSHALQQFVNNPSVELETFKVSAIRLFDLSPYDVCNSNPQLKELAWTNSQLTDFYGLEQCAALEYLDLSSNRLQMFDGGQFLGLTHLDLSNNNLRDFFFFSAAYGRLRYLNVGGNAIQTPYDLYTLVSNSPMLESLGIAGVNDYWSVLDSVMFPENITWLDVSDTQGYVDFLRFPNLQHLYADRVTDFNSYGISSFDGLETLSLQEVLIEDEAFLTALPNIRSIDLSNSRFRDPSASQLLIDFINDPSRNLKELKLANVARLEGDLHLYCSVHPQLVSLDVSGTDLFSTTGLEVCSSLKSLSVAANNLIDLYLPLGDIKLRELDVSHNPIDYVGELSLISSLQSLDISYTNIQDFQAVEQTLMQNPWLKKLGMAGLGLDSGLLISIQRPELLESLDVSDRPDVAFWMMDRFVNLRELYANRTMIEDIQFLRDLDKLEVLEARNSGIYDLYIEPGQFGALKHLDVSNNPIFDPYPLLEFIQRPEINLEVLRIADIPNLEVDVPNLCYSNNLRVLDMSGLKLMPGGSVDIAPCENLVELHLADTGIDDIVFGYSQNALRVLDVSHNQLQSFSNFEQLDHLQVLDLSYNTKLDSYSIDQVLQQLNKLKSLSLAGLPLPWGWNLQINDEQLEFLDLSNTGIESLANIQNYRSLETLLLDNNNLTDIQLLQGLESLESLELLSLSGNPIDFISFDVGQSLPGLKALNLSDTNIQDLQPLMSLFDLETLSLANLSQISVFDARNLIVNNDRLKHLDISGLVGIDLAAINLEKLETLKAADLELSYLPGNFYFEGLKVLDLSGNQLTDFPSLVDFRLLRSLNLADNEITQLDDLYELYQIEELNLANNPIVFSDLQTPYFGGETVRRLILDGIDLSNVTYLEFWGYFSLEELSLANTGIDVFDFYDMWSLKNINLSGNHLSNIQNLVELPLLETLDLSSNSQALDISIIAQLSNLESLNLNNSLVIGNANLESLVASLPELRELEVAGLDIPDLYSFVNAFYQPEQLITLNINGTLDGQIVDLGLLNDFVSLSSLNAANNGLLNLGGFDIAQLELLKTLDLSGNMIEDIYPLMLNDDLYSNLMVELINLSGNNSIPCDQLDQLEEYFVQRAGGTLVRPVNCVAGFPPNITLLSPLGGEVFNTTDIIPLSAMADDFEDGDLNASIFWESDKDGVLGMGALLDVSLSAGVHIITASVTDSHGETASMSAQIEIEQVSINYCASGGNYTYYDWIDLVIIGGISNYSGNNSGYLDATNWETPLNLQYGSNRMSFLGGTRYSYYRSWERWGVWIDFNQDGQFDSSEKVITQNGAGSEFGYYIPPSALPGTTRMRVAMSWFYTPYPCGTYSWGETEDYTVIIQ